MHTSGPSKPPVSPYLFLQAFGALEKVDATQAFDGETSQDAWNFLMRLLDRLRSEEINEVGRSPDEKTTVEKLLEGESTASVSTSSWIDIDDLG